jgi:hypothetical protein
LRSKKMSPTAVKLMIWETALDTSAHFSRDIAVLVLVFVPIDLWRKQDFDIRHYVGLVLFSGAFFIVGLALQCVASVVQRGKEIWEAEEDMA